MSDLPTLALKFDPDFEQKAIQGKNAVYVEEKLLPSREDSLRQVSRSWGHETRGDERQEEQF